MPRENQYQAGLIKRLKDLPGCVEVLKNDSSYVQGISDLSVYFENGFWAWLEVKASADADEQPNQRYHVDRANAAGAFGAFIFPENEAEVMDALQRARAA